MNRVYRIVVAVSIVGARPLAGELAEPNHLTDTPPIASLLAAEGDEPPPFFEAAMGEPEGDDAA